jgi:hypothetical protein
MVDRFMLPPVAIDTGRKELLVVPDILGLENGTPG